MAEEKKFTKANEEVKSEVSNDRYTLVKYPVQFAIGIQDNKTGEILSDQELVLTLLNKFNKQVQEI